MGIKSTIKAEIVRLWKSYGVAVTVGLLWVIAANYLCVGFLLELYNDVPGTPFLSSQVVSSAIWSLFFVFLAYEVREKHPTQENQLNKIHPIEVPP